MALNIPSKIFAGDSVSFVDSLPGYPATDGWVLNYKIVSANEIYQMASKPSGEDHSFSIATEDTAAYVAGAYKWRAYVSRESSNERYTIATGSLHIAADLSEATDQRSHVERVLDALEASIEGKASTDQSSMSINGRSIARFSPMELLEWRDRYKTELKNMKRADDIAQGIGGTNKIHTRF